MRTQQGLTLVELLVGVAILAIVFGFSVPAMGGWLESARASAARADLLASLAQASSRSRSGGARVVLCPSVDAADCSDNPDWTSGWLVFSDANASRELEAGERVLRVQRPLEGYVHLRSAAGRTRIVFQDSGLYPGGNADFTLCDGRGPAKARALVLASDGRLRDAVASAADIAATCAP